MAIGWLTVLKMVPWGDVIVNAPKIADGAMKLWSTVSRKSQSTPSAATSNQPAPASDALTIARLQAQLSAAETQIADLQHQMLESSELIKALADQSERLVRRIEMNRIRVLWLAAVVVVLAVVSTVNLVTAFTG